MSRTLPALLLLALPLLAAPVPKAVKRADDAKLIVGDWRGGTVTANGGPSGDYIFRFADDGTCGIGHGKQAPPNMDCAYTLDPTARPLKEMKWLNGSARTEWRCVYELDGDTLRVGFVHQGKGMPAEVKASPDLTVYEFKRAKEDK